MTFRILAISGSLRAASSNTRLLRAVSLLAPPGTSVQLYDGLGSLPYFNPDLEDDRLPETVARFRLSVGSADGILISSPEYAHGVPGVLKNALDWLVGGAEMPGKRIALLNASPRATHAQASLAETLRTMAAVIVTEASIDVPLLGRDLDETAIASNPELARNIRGAVNALAKRASG